MRPFLLVQSRPEDDVAEAEFDEFRRFGGFAPGELVPLRVLDGEIEPVRLREWTAVIVAGGPANFATPAERKPAEQRSFERWLFDLSRRCAEADYPYLGACLGLGSLVHALGGRMTFEAGEPAAPVQVRVEAPDDPLLHGFPPSFPALAGHKEGLLDPPRPLRVLARSEAAVQLVRCGRNVYASQFHPELDPSGLARRIRAYRGHGYFAPEEAEGLIEQAAKARIEWPMEFLRRFAARARAVTAD